MNLNDISKLFDYTEWANHLVLRAAESLDEDQQRHDFLVSHSSIQGTLVHIAGAEWIWLERWHGRSHTSIWAGDDFPDIPAIRERWLQLEAERRAFLNGLSEEGLQRDLSYKNIKGESFTLPMVQQMQHVVNHGTLHRGQVIGMVRQLGIKPPSVDLLYFLIEQKRAVKGD